MFRAGRCWRPIYKKAGRWDDAANAYGRVLDLRQPTTETLADYGEMVVYGKQGMVTVEARRGFGRGASSLTPSCPRRGSSWGWA